MYAPLSLDPSLARHTVSKIQRWALKLATYNYRIGHIAGELNVWTDLLTRWGAAVSKTISTPRKDSTLRYGSLFLAPLVTDDSDNDFPAASEALRLQNAAARNPDLKEVPPATGRPWVTSQLPGKDLDTYQCCTHADTPLCHRSLWSCRTPRSPSDSNRHTRPLLLELHEQERQGLCRLMLSLHCQCSS
jgi:hypothetical protein